MSEYEAIDLLEIMLTEKEQVTLTAAQYDTLGPKSAVKAPTWHATDPDLVSLVPSADGWSCTVMPLGPIGCCQVIARLDDEAAGSPSGGVRVCVVQSDVHFLKITASDVTKQ